MFRSTSPPPNLFYPKLLSSHLWMTFPSFYSLRLRTLNSFFTPLNILTPSIQSVQNPVGSIFKLSLKSDRTSLPSTAMVIWTAVTFHKDGMATSLLVSLLSLLPPPSGSSTLYTAHIMRLFYNLTQIGSLFCSKFCNMSLFNSVKANILKVTYTALYCLLRLPTCSPPWSNFSPVHPSLLYSSNILALGISDFLCLEETSSSDLHDKVPHLPAVFAVIYQYAIVIFITSDFLPQHVWFPFPYFTLFSYT